MTNFFFSVKTSKLQLAEEAKYMDSALAGKS